MMSPPSLTEKMRERLSGRRVKFTNLPWVLDADALAREFPIGQVALVNDFVAAVHGIDDLPPQGLKQLQAGEPLAHGTRLVLGAGTGFGAAHAVWAGARLGIAARAPFEW